MGIQRRTSEPVGIVNASGQPEIVLEIEGLTLSAAPPRKDEQAQQNQADQVVKPLV